MSRNKPKPAATTSKTAVNQPQQISYEVLFAKIGMMQVELDLARHQNAVLAKRITELEPTPAPLPK